METIGSKRSYALTWCMPNNDDDDDDVSRTETGNLIKKTLFKLNSLQYVVGYIGKHARLLVRFKKCCLCRWVYNLQELTGLNGYFSSGPDSLQYLGYLGCTVRVSLAWVALVNSVNIFDNASA